MNRKMMAILVAASASIPALAFAQSDEVSAGQVVAVQPRDYRMVHEFTASVGVLPMNAFYTGLSVGGAYTLHFNDLIGWEALSFHYSGNIDTGLEGELSDRWRVSPEGEPRLEYLAGTALVFTPLIGKLSVGNSSIVQMAGYINIGGGLARFDDGFRPQGSIGPGLRLFFNQVVSTRLDIRNVIASDEPSGVEYILHVTLSVSFNFGDRDDEEEDVTQDSRTGFEALDELYPLSNPDRVKDKKDEAEQ